MDVSRMVTAAAAVPLAVGCAALAWRCHAKGLIGRRRALVLAGAAACALAAAMCLGHAFVPRVHYVWPADEASRETREEQPADEAAGQTAGGRVTYTTASLGVQPASDSLPAREEEAEPAQDAPQQAQAAPQAEPAQDAGAEGQQAQAQDAQDAAPATDAGTTAPAAAASSTTTTAATSAPSSAPSAAATAQAPAALDVPAPTGTATVEVIDAGAACSLVTLPSGGRVLVDAGAAGSSDALLARLSELGVGALDALVLTSCSDASMGGAAELLSHVRVSLVLMPSSASGELAQAVADEASRTGASLSRVSSQTAALSEGGCEVDAAPAGGGLVAKVSFGGRVAVLSACAAASDAALAVPGRVDVLVCGSADPDSARGMWPALAAASSDDAETQAALAMAAELGGAGASRAAMGADGSLAAEV